MTIILRKRYKIQKGEQLMSIDKIKTKITLFQIIKKFK